MSTTLPAPLDDPTYTPQHPPVDGQVPAVVAKWGPRSQIRWFRRFGRELAPRRDWSQYHVHSEHHLGTCCDSCFDEYLDGTGVQLDGWCCCRDQRIAP
ncbi:hypothetical protein ABZX77_30455 [Streptomyces sp. NPDC004237]|uniref:hypothetical protein n=1 Tax=Streptomyces sp. NPDC004237 TaxID=3154455 RepID=UPI0033A40F34